MRPVHKNRGRAKSCFVEVEVGVVVGVGGGGVTGPSDWLNLNCNVMFMPYLLYKKTTRCTFACVAFFFF